MKIFDYSFWEQGILPLIFDGRRSLFRWFRKLMPSGKTAEKSAYSVVSRFLVKMRHFTNRKKCGIINKDVSMSRIVTLSLFYT
jgi:hypothetical protein